MIEAVGHEYWSTYFQTIDRLLAPGGRVGLQAITMPHDRMLATRRTYTWINKYIFPGGFLPSVEAIEEITRARHHACGSATGCRSAATTRETLRRWDDAFLAAPATACGRSASTRRSVRMWHFYLEYSRAGFASGYIDVNQIVLERPASSVTPRRRPSGPAIEGLMQP